MKVLVITTVRFRQNGITTVMMNYFNQIINENIHMDFVGPNEISSPYREIFEDRGVTYYSLPMRKKNPLLYYKRLKKIMIKGSYDIVHVHGSSCLITLELLAAKQANIKVRVAHSHNSSCEHPQLHKLLMPLFRSCYTLALACGEEAGKWMFNNDPFTIIPNGIDLLKYKFNPTIRCEIRKQLQIENNVYVLGCIAGFQEVKNHMFLVKIMKQFKQRNCCVKCLLIGDGSTYNQVVEEIKKEQLDEYFILTGNLVNAYEYYNAMDLFVLPSFYEGFPMVLVEAQANALACLVSNNVTNKTNLNGHVRYASIDDASVWVDNIMKYMYIVRVDNVKSHQLLVEKGFSVKQNFELLMKLYEESLNK